MNRYLIIIPTIFFTLTLLQNAPIGQTINDHEIYIKEGSGSFEMKGGTGNKDKTITVFYHKPKNFNAQSEILIVVPGSGRDGDEYRDAWIKPSENHGVLILSPQYPQQEYDFGQYHMGGLMYDMQLKESVTHVHNSNEIILNEEVFAYKVNEKKEEWIFSDFDRLFDIVVDATASSQTGYDIFGHSAGGQILHRFTLFHPGSKANSILASNSGFYTMPDLEAILPFGLKNTPVKKESLRKSFNKNLVLFIGEKDNQNETGGILLRSPSADRQGLHRLERGKYFYEKAKILASEMEANFNWKIEIVPNIGHDFENMSKAAAEYLYN